MDAAICHAMVITRNAIFESYTSSSTVQNSEHTFMTAFLPSSDRAMLESAVEAPSSKASSPARSRILLATVSCTKNSFASQRTSSLQHLSGSQNKY